MRDDAIAEILGAHVATSQPNAELWHRVAHGELSPDEAAAQVLAGRDDVGEDERAELERAKRVFGPLSEEQREVQLERLLARQAAERAAEDEDDDEDEAEEAEAAEAVVVPMRSQRTRRWAVGLMAVAAAVVLTLLVIPPPGSDLGPFPRGATVELDKAVATMRGSEPQAEVPTFLLDGKIGIRLIPEEAVKGPVGVVAYAWDRSGEAQGVTLDAKVNAKGVVDIDTTVKALGLGEGEWELVFAFGWTEALPGSWEEIAAVGEDGPEGFEVLRKRVRVVTGL